jgi:hypothetical protein
MLPSDEAQDWIAPSELLEMMNDPRFEKKAGIESDDQTESVAVA